MFVIASIKVVYFLASVFFRKVVPLKYNAQNSFGKSILKKTYRFNLFLAISELLIGHKKKFFKGVQYLPQRKNKE